MPECIGKLSDMEEVTHALDWQFTAVGEVCMRFSWGITTNLDSEQAYLSLACLSPKVLTYLLIQEERDREDVMLKKVVTFFCIIHLINI